MAKAAGASGNVAVVVPMKAPAAAKTRLRGARTGRQHADLVRAIAADTLAAASRVRRIRRILVVSADPESLRALAIFDEGIASKKIELVAEDPAEPGLNGAVRHGESILRADDPTATIAAMHGDLPALRTAELTAALRPVSTRTFCADRHGTGTTLLISPPHERLRPQFGVRSAVAHADSGATPLTLPVPSVRADVDTPADLRYARTLGLGAATAALLGDPAASAEAALDSADALPSAEAAWNSVEQAS